MEYYLFVPEKLGKEPNIMIFWPKSLHSKIFWISIDLDNHKNKSEIGFCVVFLQKVLLLCEEKFMK